eukprot:gene10609-biopygen15660
MVLVRTPVLVGSIDLVYVSDNCVRVGVIRDVDVSVEWDSVGRMVIDSEGTYM